ncbi:MAG: alpha/beta hydrolase [Pseudomonadota bacterium]
MKSCFAMFLALGVFSSAFAFDADKQRFQFSYQSLTYTGEILYSRSEAKATVVLIPGHGTTDLVEGDQFKALREFLLDQSYNVAYWDKAGCGLSEGEYDHFQSIPSSAAEAIEALKVLEAAEPDPGKLGFWSISRGGWIVPKIFESYDDLAFWISVSGTSELDNSRYMLEANLKAEGRTQQQIELLMGEWDDYQRILVRGGSLEEFNAATGNLMLDPYFNSNDFRMTEDGLRNIQSFYRTSDLDFDEASNLAIMYADLPSALKAMDVPVLSLLGRLDTQIDWQATGLLYAEAAKAGAMQLSQIYLDNCNHVMQQSQTGGVNEVLPTDVAPCEGYYEGMASWLKRLNSDDPSAH